MGTAGLYDDPEAPPIPTYEEATSSNQERRSLLSAALNSGSGRRRDGYQAPTVESPRESEDSMKPSRRSRFGSDDEDSDDDSVAGLDRQFEQMEVLDSDVLGEGGSYFHNRWKDRLSGFKRRMGRWKKMWVWRRPTWLEGVGTSGSWFTLPENFTRLSPSLPIVARLFGLFLIVMAGYALFVWEIMPAGQSGMGMFDPEGVRMFVQNAVDGDRIRDYVRHFSQYSHMAGTKGSEVLAKDMKEFMYKVNLDDVEVDTHWIYMNWASSQGRRVAIIDPPDMVWEASLDESSPYEDASPSQANSLPFHTYAKAGNVTGPLVYANYGLRSDYQMLHDKGIDLKDAIVLIRNGPPYSDLASSIKGAEAWGVRGVLTFPDPKEDGAARGATWPNGKYRPDDSVQRGAAGLSGWVIGDPLTPGWASSELASRLKKDNTPGLVQIPSLPLSWQQAQKLLQAIKGHGQHFTDPAWMAGVPDVDWWTGDKSSPVLLLQNELREGEKERIFNVIGTMRGDVESSKQVVVGAHRDAWCFGAADSASGTAILLEVMEIFGELRKQGWRPLRTIKFASWDAKHYNMAGSTEWVEANSEDLQKNGVAYLNIDVGVTGSNLRAKGSPSIQQAFRRVINRISDPVRGMSLRDWWDSSGSVVEGAGAGGDYVAFQTIAGMSTFDIGFEGDGYPSQSCYDTFEWMEKFGDPDFNYHKVLAQIWALLILEVAQEPILPLRIDDYADALMVWLTELGLYAKASGDGSFRATPIWEAVKLLGMNAAKFHAWEDWWYGQVIARGGFETTSLELARVTHNNRLSDFESNLLDLGGGAHDGITYPGLPNRTQFKHVIHGPQLWASGKESYFPAIRDAIDARDWPAADRQVENIARILKQAAEKLDP